MGFIEGTAIAFLGLSWSSSAHLIGDTIRLRVRLNKRPLTEAGMC